ncbi:MAG: caspase family protein [Cyanobacteria bacterium J06592_8]
MARYALVIGISTYQDRHLSMLSKAYTDAHAVAKVLEKDTRYKNVDVLTERVTQSKLATTLRNFLQKQAVHNEALIYFTGHGFQVVDPLGIEEPTGYLATEDCTLTLEDKQIKDQSKGFPLSSLSKLIADSNLSNLVLLLDACHSGNFLEQNSIKTSLLALTKKVDYYLITACRGHEVAISKKQDEHSVFTGALLEALSKSNANEKGEVTVERLFEFISHKLRDTTQETLHMGYGRSIVVLQHNSLSPGQSAGKGLNALAEMMRDPKVRNIVNDFKREFQNSREQIKLLSAYKAWHDELHKLETHFYRTIQSAIIRLNRGERDDLLWSDVILYITDLHAIIKQIEKISVEPCLARNTTDTDMIKEQIRTLRQIEQHLQVIKSDVDANSDQIDLVNLKKVQRSTYRLIGTPRSMVNGYLVKAAESLKLSRLVESILDIQARIQDNLSDWGINSEKLSEFHSGITALKNLNQKLTIQIANHNHWQSIDNELHNFEGSLSKDLEELESFWDDTKRKIENHLDEDEIEYFRKKAKQLEQEIQAKNHTRVNIYFREIHRQATNHFERVDIELGKSCSDLGLIDNPLNFLFKNI